MNRITLALFTFYIPFLFIACAGNKSIPESGLHPKSGTPLIIALNGIVSEISSSPLITDGTIMAVVDFNALDGRLTYLGKHIAEGLTTSLFQSKKIKVIERSLLDKAIDELKFNLSGYVGEEFEKNAGEMLGADAILTGTITSLTDTILINTRVIDVESGEILGSTATEVKKDGNIIKMFEETIKVVAEKDQEQERGKGILVLISEKGFDGNEILWWRDGKDLSDSTVSSSFASLFVKNGLFVVDSTVYFEKIQEDSRNAINYSEEHLLGIARMANAEIVIIGKAVSTYQGELEGLESVRVNLTVRGLKTDTAEIIATASVSEPALHLNKTLAEKNALHKAAETAVEGIFENIKGIIRGNKGRES